MRSQPSPPAHVPASPPSHGSKARHEAEVQDPAWQRPHPTPHPRDQPKEATIQETLRHRQPATKSSLNRVTLANTRPHYQRGLGQLAAVPKNHDGSGEMSPRDGPPGWRAPAGPQTPPACLCPRSSPSPRDLGRAGGWAGDAWLSLSQAGDAAPAQAEPAEFSCWQSRVPCARAQLHDSFQAERN